VNRDDNIVNVIIGFIVILMSIVGGLSQLFRKLQKPGAEEKELPEWEIESEEPAEPRPRVRDTRRRAEPVAAALEQEVAETPATPEPVPEPPVELEGRPRVTLDERLFANRRLSIGAKLVLSKEILDGPRWGRTRR
jgi:hypothetical protein